MESLRQIGAGFLLSLLSISVVLGGFVVSQAEGGLANTQPEVTPAPTQAPVTVLPTLPILTNTPLPSLPPFLTVTAEPTLTLAPTQTPPPPPVSCPPPNGWTAIQVMPGMSLVGLAQTYQTSLELLKQNNCLFSDQLEVGSFLYVPFRPTATFIPCGPPPGWVSYRVLPGDTLFNISFRYQVTVAQLQMANCLGGSTFIKAGTLIKVPNVAPLAPTATPFYPTALPSSTPVPSTATSAPPSATLISIPTTSVPATTEVPPTATLPPTSTPVTPEPTLTPEPSATTVPPPTSTPVTPSG